MKTAFELLSTPPPNLSESYVASILQKQYGIEGALKVLVSERDQNFAVEPKFGESFVFKIANSAEAAGVTEFQIAALLHIDAQAPDLLVPRVVPARNGTTSIKIVGEDGRVHIARVLSWLEGIPLRFADPKPDIAAASGSFLAQLGQALSDFEHPASDHVLLWDLSHAGQLAILLDNIDDDTQREICRQRLQHFESHTKPALQKLRSQVIYNDLNSSNLLVDPKDPESITGIIDFGDMVKSHLVVDIAVAAAYLCKGGDDPLSSIVSFLGGYSQISPLLCEEIELLYELIILRNVMTIVITHWRAAHYPDNRDYILRNEPRARSTIDTLIAQGQSSVTDTFRKACQS